ncbi:extracellular solute-binding protein [Roseomonas fluvialis]|nr:extracellular solute-binding protein [Roseomonas fluvialis]
MTTSRRRVLGALSGVTGSTAWSLPAAAQERRLVANTYPGLWEEAHRLHLLPAFKRVSGIDATLTPMLAVDVIARLAASRGTPPFDVILNDEGPFLANIDQDFFETLDASKLPNLADIPQKFIDPTMKGVYVSAQIIGLAYNPARVQTPPTSWDDLARPEYRGRVGITGPGSSLAVAWLVETAKLHGGSEANLEPAFAQLRKIMPNVGAVTAHPGQLITLFQQGEIDVSFSYLNLIAPLKARGVPVELVKPETGWVLLRNGVQIVKNTRSPQLAHAYVNAYLGREVQAGLAAAPYYLAPTNTAVPFGGELQTIGQSMADLERSVIIDWAKINPQRSALIERFNRETRA